MSDLILYLGITLVGYVLGTKIRDKKESFSWTGKVQLVALVVLVLLMGMRMGANEEVTDNISTIGVSALIMTVFAVGFSVMAITLARKVMGIDRYGRLKGEAAGKDEKNERAAGENNACGEAEKGSGNTMTYAIIVSVLIGMVMGYMVIRPMFAGNMETFESVSGMGLKIGLCILLIFVGTDLGIEGTVVENFKKVGLRILVFPFAVVIGTLVGSLVCSLFLDFSAKECLAIGAGFGWYTLAPGIIMEHGYVAASAVSFLHNVLRELSSIILIPIVADKIGYVEVTGMPGAAAMDVCLPVVEKSTRSDIAVYSFVSGVVLSTLVPILVPIIIG